MAGSINNDEQNKDVLNFEQIIESVSLNDIIRLSEKSNAERMSVEKQRFELAKIARLIVKGHAGYETWDDEVKKQFAAGVERLYNGAIEGADIDAFYQNLDKVLQNLPDEHLRVYNPRGNPMPREYNECSVGGNLVAEKEPGWRIYNDENIGVIALPYLGNTGPDKWKEFSKELDDKLFNSDGSAKYSSLVIDVRDNPGGTSIPFEILARKLYGNEVAPLVKSEYRDTPEGDYIRCISGEISRDAFEDRIKMHQYTGKMKTICDYSKHEEECPAFVNGGYKRPIFVMTNRNTASAGEGLCQFLKYHPSTVFVGENTAGCYAEISGKSVDSDLGYGVKIASMHASFGKDKDGKDNVFERKGFAPDVCTKGVDAYAYIKDKYELLMSMSHLKLHNFSKKASKGSKEGFNRLAHNDFAFIRAINSGMSVEQAKGLYAEIYPDKPEMFANIEKYVSYQKTSSLEYQLGKDNFSK